MALAFEATMSGCSDLPSFYFLGTGGLDRSDEKGIDPPHLRLRLRPRPHQPLLPTRPPLHKGISVPESLGDFYLALGVGGAEALVWGAIGFGTAPTSLTFGARSTSTFCP